MGDYRIEILASGGHGCNRAAKEGEPIGPPLHGENSGCPDCEAAAFVAKLQRAGSIKSATLTHWPGQHSQVIDDLNTRKRKRGHF